MYGAQLPRPRHTGAVDVDGPERAAIVERMLREYAGTIPDKQLLEEIGLALAIWRRGRL